MSFELPTTQQSLNRLAGTTGLTKQQCWQYIAGPAAIGMTSQDAANIACTAQGGRKSIQDDCKQIDGFEGMSIQEHVRRF